MKLFVRYFLSSVLLASLLFMAGCGSSGQLKSGETLFQEKNYNLAANVLRTEYSEESVERIKAEKAFMIGQCYEFTADYNNAAKWYEEAIRLGYDPIATYKYALALKAQEKYQQAIDQFTKYAREEPFKRDVALEQIKQCYQVMKWQKEKSQYDIVNLTNINTQASEYGPVILPDGNMVFTSDRFDATGDDTYGWTGDKFSDLYLSKKQSNGDYSGVVPFAGNLNTGFNEGTPCFNATGTEMYFTRCGAQGPQDNYCGIYYSSQQTMGGWSEPVKLALFNDTVNVGHPFLLKDGSALIFSADADGGYGGNDLYIMYKNGTYWTEPQNLGNEINTTGDELFPFVADDGTLYFSSNGQTGLGGMDIFSAEKDGKVWKNVENLKMPINSGFDDFGVWFTKTRPRDANDPIRQQGFFSSNRPGGAGKDDIYMFTLSNENLYVLEGVVLEKIFEDPKDPNSPVVDFQPVQGAHIELKKYMTKNPDVGSGTSDDYGRFSFDLEKNSNYYVSADKAGFLKRSVNCTTKGLRDLNSIVITVKVRLIMERIYVDRQIVIPNIYYDYDSASLRPESFPVLDTLFTLFQDNPDIVVEIGSHTDSRGSDSYNMTLSQNRAQSVVAYLVKKGIPAQRLKAVGYGETQLVNGCSNGVDCTEEQHQQNRRTTFKILGEKFQIESIQPDSVRVDPKDGE